MTPDGLIGLLSSVSCGAFVLTTDQTVVFWNERAREILGYRPDRVVGRRCSSIAGGVAGVTLSEGCEDGCPIMRSLRDGQMPSRGRLRARCSWGEWKWLVVTPMAVSGVEQSGPLLVYLFGDTGEEAALADVERLVALGMPGRAVRQERYELADYEDLSFGMPIPGSGEDEELPEERMLIEASGPGERVRLDDFFSDLGTRPEASQSAEPAERGDASGGARPGQPEVRLTDRQLEVLSYLALGWGDEVHRRGTGR